MGAWGDRQAETTVSAAWSAALLPLAPYPWKAELVREESSCVSTKLADSIRLEGITRLLGVNFSCGRT